MPYDSVCQPGTMASVRIAGRRMVDCPPGWHRIRQKVAAARRDGLLHRGMSSSVPECRAALDRGCDESLPPAPV